MEKYDFSGWATKNDLRCSDGRTIRHNAFKDNDGKKVPLVWNHMHGDPDNVLGHAMLENQDDGVRCYGYFNDTQSGQIAKVLVQHGDINALSIYANGLKQIANDVIHGDIKEVSLVHAGANPGAFIDTVISHSEDSDEEAIIYSGVSGFDFAIEHADKNNEEKAEMAENEKKKVDESEETVADVFDTLTEKQKTVVYALLGQAIADATEEKKEDDPEMKHNVFDSENTNEVLSHSEMVDILADAKRCGSLKDSFLQHGITDVENLFPDAQPVNVAPEFYSREVDWVSYFMNRVHKTPFSRVKSWYADLTADEARAKGFVKGKEKVEEVIAAAKRVTTPQTIYKKQKLDRDDVLDITDFDVVAWLKKEMRAMLEEEIARAALVGDGRPASSDDKISPLNIRPIWGDDALYTINATVNKGASADADAKGFIRAVVKARKEYKGSGNAVLFTTEDVLTDLLLMEDTTGRVIYDTVDKLATALRVSKILTVPVMENLTRVDGDNTHQLMGIVVDLADYNIGADRGGAVSMFDDFDIDMNAQKYLIETRCSGALTKLKSAISIELVFPTPSKG